MTRVQETVETPSRRPTFHIGGGLLARNTGMNLVGRVLPLLIGVAAMPYVTRQLGPDLFGLLALAWMVVGYFALFDLGLGAAVTKFVAEHLGKGEMKRVPALIWTAIGTQLCIGSAAGLLLAAATPFLVEHLLKIPMEIRPEGRSVFLILSASLPISFVSGSLNGVLAASQRFDLLNMIGVPSSAITYLAPVLGLAFGLTLPEIVLILLLARVAALGALFGACGRLYPVLRAKMGFDYRLVRPLLNFGGWVAVSGAIVPILVYFDRVLIGSLLSVAAVGFYTPPFMVASKLGILPISLSETLFPAVSTSSGRGDTEWIRRALVRSSKYMLLVVGPVALTLVFFSHALLEIWLGSRFASQGTLVLQLLAVGMMANSLTYVPYTLIQGMGRPDLTAKLQFAQLPIHLTLAWFLVSHFALPGAALAWSARMVIEFLIFIVAGCCLTRTSSRLLASREVWRTVGILAAFAVGLVCLWFSTQGVVMDVVLVGFLGAMFLIASWRYGLDAEEKRQIRSWLGV